MLEVTPVTVEEDNLATTVNKTDPVDGVRDTLIELIDSMLESDADQVDMSQTPAFDTTIELNPILSILNTSPDFMRLNTCYAEEVPFHDFSDPKDPIIFIDVINDNQAVIETINNYLPCIIDNLF